MKNELPKILESVPKKVLWSDIVEFDRFDDRLSAVGIFNANTIGVSEEYIEFDTDNESPLREETLSWIWCTGLTYRMNYSNWIYQKILKC